MTRIFHFYLWIDQWFARILRWALLLMVLALGGMVFLQVVLRNLFHDGILGVEIISRNLVLWIAFLGAMLGTRTRQHISVDLFPRLLSRRPRNALRILLDAMSCAVTLYLAKASYIFMLDERLMGETILSFIPSWYAVAVIPFGFVMISLEYAIGVVLDVRRVFIVGDVNEAGDWRKYMSM